MSLFEGISQATTPQVELLASGVDGDASTTAQQSPMSHSFAWQSKATSFKKGAIGETIKQFF